MADKTASLKLPDGKSLDFTATGLLARALQHEVDHLNGVLYIDRLSAALADAAKGIAQTIPARYTDLEGPGAMRPAPRSFGNSRIESRLS